MQNLRSDDLWSRYADALHEIMRLQEELSSKDNEIKKLTETIVQMKLELAMAKATEDDLGMQLRRASIVLDPTVVEKAMAEEKSERRTSHRISGRNELKNKHSNSIAVQNPSAQGKTRPVVPRHKSDSWALRAEPDGSDDGELAGSLKHNEPIRHLKLPNCRLGFVLGAELDNNSMQRKSGDSSRDVQDAKKLRDPPPPRGLGCFVRRLSLGIADKPTQPQHEGKSDKIGESPSLVCRPSLSIADKALPTQPLQDRFEQRGEKTNEDALTLRRPRAIPRERCDLKSSAVIFPVESCELLSAFTEKRGQIGKDFRLEWQNTNEEWS